MKNRYPDLRIIVYGYIIMFLSSIFVVIILSTIGCEGELRTSPLRDILSKVMATLYLILYIRLRTNLSFINDLKLGFNISIFDIFITAGIILLLTGFSYAANFLYSYLNLKPIVVPLQPSTYIISIIKAGADKGLILLNYGLAGPIFEELFFRGITFNVMKRLYNTTFAIIGSSIIFAITHIEPIYYPYYFITGVVLALLYETRKKLFLTFLVHSASNVIYVYSLFSRSM